MGLLDDAIREHLDLKRRRGADPAEVERAEREALGPVRRSPEPLEVDAVEHEKPPADAYDDDRDPDFAYDHEADQAFASDHEPEFAYDEEPVAHEAVEEDELTHEHDLPPAPESFRLSETARGPQPGFEGETAEFDVENAIAEEAERPAVGADGEDVLEETPEFLQDAPEHDRLWFEQRPPRDFDFDR